MPHNQKSFLHRQNRTGFLCCMCCNLFPLFSNQLQILSVTPCNTLATRNSITTPWLAILISPLHREPGQWAITHATMKSATTSRGWRRGKRLSGYLLQLSSLQCSLRRAQQAAQPSLGEPTSPSNWHKIDVHPLIRSYVGSTMKSALKNPAPRSMTVACLTPCVSRAGFVQA